MESNAERKRKLIVEHIIKGFDTADEAIVFGNTLESLVNEKVKTKYRQQIGSENTKLAITPMYNGKTVLKTCFLEVMGTAHSNFICDKINSAINAHKDVHHKDLEVLLQIVREKPQPQIIGV